MPQYDLAGNPLPDDTPPRTDLAGNPLPQSGPPPGYSQQPYGGPPPAGGYAPPPGYGAPPPYGQQPGAWPPPPTNNPYGQLQQNTSGMNSTVPPEIAAMKWNWGAFSLPFLWSLNHKMRGYAAIAFVLAMIDRATGTFDTPMGIASSLVFLAFSIYMGVKGNELAWRNRRFDGGVTQFISTQRAWMGWGIAIFILGVIAFGFVTFFLGASGGTQAPSGGSQPSPF
ncbi:MAG: hypothetical protein ABIY70_25355 [Capsulimonas sp.]|uniref:hypothetical protein n=1 Tax=Capsulimonas sp. TaxID=2494211 RepID=UPI003266B671